MECRQDVITYLSWIYILGGLACLRNQSRQHIRYGRYRDELPDRLFCPAKVAWLVQEVPSLLAPVLLLLNTESSSSLGRNVLLGTFCLHYFHRSFIYSWMTRGRSCPVRLVVYSAIFCGVNGLLQGHHLLHCSPASYPQPQLALGLPLFYLGMAINIHSDSILRQLRRPGEEVYRIPRGGMFEYVSGANFFGEVLEWCGYAVATWSLPTFSFAFFTICSLGPRAWHHHRYYQQNFKDYPTSRKALIPFIL